MIDLQSRSLCHLQRYAVADKQFSHIERRSEHGNAQQHEFGPGPGIGEQKEGGASAQVSECRVRCRLFSPADFFFPQENPFTSRVPFQTKKLSRQSGLGG